jgi:hypothetical protein
MRIELKEMVGRRKLMTRLDRVLKLLEDYDDLAEAALCDILDCEDAIRSLARLTSLRAEKDQLTQELIKHGCRRKN